MIDEISITRELWIKNSSYFHLLHQNLAEEWKDLGAVSGVLAADSGNVVELIRDNYKV